MKKILLVSGHGAGDSGAVGCGFAEADLTRKATYILDGKFREYDVSVTRYSTARNCYEDLKKGVSVNFKSYDLVIEVHFNSASASAHGSEVLYRDRRVEKLAAEICRDFAARGFANRGAKIRTDLKVMNTCNRAGVPYILIETCFISSASDMELYKRVLYSLWGDVAATVAKFYGIKKLASVSDQVPTNKTTTPVGTASVSVYGSHGRGKDEVWYLDPDKKVAVPKTVCFNYKKL